MANKGQRKYGYTEEQDRTRKMPEKALVLIRYGISEVLRCRNALTSKLSIISQYGGRVLGLAEEVVCIEGNWPTNLGLAVLEFDSLFGAQNFNQATPDIKQPDWLGGVDVITARCRITPQSGKDWFQLLDLQVYDKEKYMIDYVPGHQEEARKHGATLAIVDDNQAVKYRGMWDPSTLIIHQWPSEEAFRTWYNSKENEQWRLLRNSIAKSDVALVKLSPLRTEYNPANNEVSSPRKN